MSGDVVAMQAAEPAPIAVQSESGALISMIERAARDPAVDIDKFDRLMVWKEKIDRNNSVRAFNDAVALAKGEFGSITKNRVVDFTSQKGRTNYRHEDFANVASVVDPVLSKHGLSYRYRSAQNGQRLTVTCILNHRDGHSEETSLEISEDHSGNKNAIQAVGSAATYLQRYTLKLALGLASSHDDDAQKAGASSSSGFITEAQQQTLRKQIAATATDIDSFLTFARAENLAEIKAEDFQMLRGLLAKKQQKGETNG